MKKTYHYLLILGCIVFTQVDLKAQLCQLNCNDHINASLPANSCTRTFDADDFLENPDDACTQYSLNLVYPFGTSKLDGISVDRSHVGYTFTYQIRVGNNSCWGYLTVEDKAPPQPFCKSGTISCFQFSKINDLVKEIIDNCAQEGHSVIERITWSDYGCDSPAITGRVIRTIRSFDQWNNSGVCSDTLRIRKDSFGLLKAPDMINLSCILSCKKNGNTGSVSDPKNFDLITFSPDEKNANYPSPEKLIDLQKRDTFSNSLKKCIPSNLKVVPFIQDSVFRIQNGICFRDDTCISMWPVNGLLCKMLLTYSDLTFDLCGAGFKIRREWKFTNWCTATDTTIIQYITVEDKVAPIVKTNFTLPFQTELNVGVGVLTLDLKMIIPGYRVNAVTSAHDCYAKVCIPGLDIEDCSKVKQEFTVTYTDPTKEGSILVKTGNVGECITLPANPNNYVVSEAFINSFGSLDALKAAKLDEPFKDYTLPRNCFPVLINTLDECYNSTQSNIEVRDLNNSLLASQQTEVAGFALVCITDETPPNPVCDEITQTTIDPDKCWSRVYAADLDNGSKDNCCSILHFAVAQMDTVEYYKAKYTKQLEDSCGKAEFWKYKNEYDELINNWINCYVFRDYIDLTECKENQLILRVYEACGVPVYDEHIFKCSPHDWFCYNTYPHFFLWHNYRLLNEQEDYCTSRYPWLCMKKQTVLIDSLLNSNKKYWLPQYPGATRLILYNTKPLQTAYCYPEFYYGQGLLGTEDNTSSSAPGNTCGKRLYADCMIRILIDDKTPPVAENIGDKFWYCDDVSSSEGDIYEYANCLDDSYEDDNGKDKTCVDENNLPYNYIENRIENDVLTLDTLDATGKYFGWYGCNIYGGPHPDEHGDMEKCDNELTWAPIYCRSWLILDSNDVSGKVNPKSRFDVPVLNSGTPNGSAGKGRFYIWDNCWIDPSSLDSTDESFFDKCGNGWIKRTWKVKDKCGNSVSVDQKITTKHRSDFEVEFPEDEVTTCGNTGDLSPEVLGKPIVMDDECELVGVNYTDQKFDIVPDACYKIIRTWRIIDWCKYDPNIHERQQDIIVDDRRVADSIKRPCVYRHVKDNGDGYITYIQIILIRDTIAPVTTSRDTTICFYDNNCAIQSISLPISATDNCTAKELLSYRYEIDENPSSADTTTRAYNKNSIDKKSGTVTNLSLTQKIGTSIVHIIAEDNCGNEDTTSFLLTIKDCKKPTPYCYHGIATVVMPSTGEIKVWAKDLNAGSYDNCTEASKLKFSFGPLLQDSCKAFNCKDIPNGVTFTFEIDLYVTDEAGNTDYCRTFVNVQDGSGDVCEDANSSSIRSITGNIQNPVKEPIEHVMVELSSGSNHLPSFKTNSTGQYAFTSLPMLAAYSIKPKKTDLPANGVTTIDLLKIQRHILGLEPFNEAHLFIAADINNDKEITTSDLIELRKLILNIDEEFKANSSWRFIPKSFAADIKKPFDFPEKIDINNLNQDELNKDFVGIKIGDVNNTALAHTLLGSESRSGQPVLNFEVTDRVLQAGQVATIDFITEQGSNLQTLQFTLAHHNLEIIDVIGKNIPMDGRHFTQFKGYSTWSWDNATNHRVSKGLLFSLRVRALATSQLSSNFIIHSKLTPAEAYNGREIMNVGIKFNNLEALHGFAVFQNTPNPFKAQTLIQYTLPLDQSVELSITDLTGKMVLQEKVFAKKGLNTWMVDRQKLTTGGVYYYKVDAGNFSSTKKMILVQ